VAEAVGLDPAAAEVAVPDGEATLGPAAGTGVHSAEATALEGGDMGSDAGDGAATVFPSRAVGALAGGAGTDSGTRAGWASCMGGDGSVKGVSGCVASVVGMIARGELHAHDEGGHC